MANVWQEVSFSALKKNVAYAVSKTGSVDKIIAVVKANAYGHGVHHVVPLLRSCGVRRFAVGCVSEAIELRSIGIADDILILGVIADAEIPLLVRYNLTATVSSLLWAKKLHSVLEGSEFPLKVHLKIDTGMGRFGVLPHEAPELMQYLKEQNCFHVEGVYTHFYAAESDVASAYRQLKSFESTVVRLERIYGVFPVRHVANSSGLFHVPESRLYSVRLGLTLYGLSLCPEQEEALQPVMQWKTRILCIKYLPAGHNVGYGQTFKTERPTRLGIIPVGYSHGLPRDAMQGSFVWVENMKIPVCGRLCMDHTMLDITDFPQVQEYAEVNVLGSVQDFARRMHCLPYEVLCAVDSRIPKKVVGVELQDVSERLNNMLLH